MRGEGAVPARPLGGGRGGTGPGAGQGRRRLQRRVGVRRVRFCRRRVRWCVFRCTYPLPHPAESHPAAR